MGSQFGGVTAEGRQSLRSRPGFQSKVVRVLHVAILFTDMFLLVWQGRLVDQRQEFSISFTKSFVVKNHWVSPKGAGCPGGSCLGTLGWTSIAILCGLGNLRGCFFRGCTLSLASGTSGHLPSVITCLKSYNGQ